MKVKNLFAIMFLIVLVLSGCSNNEITPPENREISSFDSETVSENMTTQPIKAEKLYLSARKIWRMKRIFLSLSKLKNNR